MPVVSKLRDGRWLMTYEVCGQSKALNCESRYKTSADGWVYGDTAPAGTKMQDAQGRFFAGTPVNFVLPNGELLWMAKYLRTADGELTPDNDMAIFKSASGSPDGPWVPIAAPVTRPNPVIANNCDGYSPGLQWAAKPGALIMVTARLESGTCNMYYGSGPAK